MLITKLAFLCFTRSSLSTLKTVVNVSEIPSGNNFLRLNKTVKCQNKPMLIKEFFNAGIFQRWAVPLSWLHETPTNLHFSVFKEKIQ